MRISQVVSDLEVFKDLFGDVDVSLGISSARGDGRKYFDGEIKGKLNVIIADPHQIVLSGQEILG